MNRDEVAAELGAIPGGGDQVAGEEVLGGFESRKVLSMGPRDTFSDNEAADMNINGIGHAVPKTYEEIGTLVARSRSQDTAALIAGDVISVLAKAVEPLTTQESEDFISELGLLSILVARESLLTAEGRKGIGMESNLVDFASIASGLTESQVYATLARLKKDTTEVMEFGTPSLIAILTIPFFLGNAHSAIASLEEKATRHGLSSDAP